MARWVPGNRYSYRDHWVKAKGELARGVVEGFNSKVKMSMRKSYGFRTFRGTDIALYHAMGDFPKPKFTPRFLRTFISKRPIHSARILFYSLPPVLTNPFS